MLTQILIFSVALFVLIISARFFTTSAEIIGTWMKLPSFVIGIFIVGIGTSLPELISGLISINKGVSEILPGNIMGANISNLLLITGVAVVLNRKTITLSSSYLYIDLHFLIGSFIYFVVIAYDGVMDFSESIIGLFIFIVYAIYLIKGGVTELDSNKAIQNQSFPFKSMLFLLLACAGIYFGADYTVSSLDQIATSLHIPRSIIALTLLSLGTTLPELAVNIAAINQGKAEMAIGNILGSSVFNTLVIPSIASLFGTIQVPNNLISFSLPFMAACGLLFYLLTQDKKISVWEGLMFMLLYVLFIIKVIAL
ncbi:MAG: sodium:calcium antiporter [Chitinophagaceae bacterium]|nr:sodium:calcium antiporter [Chitinophagaceae bacterium]